MGAHGVPRENPWEANGRPIVIPSYPKLTHMGFRGLPRILGMLMCKLKWVDYPHFQVVITCNFWYSINLIKQITHIPRNNCSRPYIFYQEPLSGHFPPPPSAQFYIHQHLKEIGMNKSTMSENALWLFRIWFWFWQLSGNDIPWWREQRANYLLTVILYIDKVVLFIKCYNRTLHIFTVIIE